MALDLIWSLLRDDVYGTHFSVMHCLLLVKDLNPQCLLSSEDETEFEFFCLHCCLELGGENMEQIVQQCKRGGLTLFDIQWYKWDKVSKKGSSLSKPFILINMHFCSLFYRKQSWTKMTVPFELCHLRLYSVISFLFSFKKLLKYCFWQRFGILIRSKRSVLRPSN